MFSARNAFMAGVAKVTDLYWKYVTLLVKNIGIGGATNGGSFCDESSYKLLAYRTGDVAQGSYSPFDAVGYWSTYFNESTDYLSFAKTGTATTATDFAGDFTIEAWVNLGNTTQTSGVASIYNGSNGWWFGYRSSSVGFSIGNGDYWPIITIPYNTVGQWVHVAFCRSGSTLRGFLNGVQSVSTTYSNSFASAAPSVWVGTLSSGLQRFNGYISNVRANNTALYTSNFTPSTAPLTAVAGTVFLACQDNRAKDNSSFNHSVTVSGNPLVSRFSPFGKDVVAPTVTPTGSVYFPSGTSYMTVPDNAALQFGSGDFTVEFWWCPTGTLAYSTPFDKGFTSPTGLLLQTNNTIASTIDVFAGGSKIITANSPIPLYRWTHVALCRNGSTMTLYQNGISAGSATNSTNFVSSSNLVIGNDSSLSSNSGFVGYLSNFRFVKGTAVYTGNFTPPTSPLTAISGTSLLTAQAATTVTDASPNNFTVTRLGSAAANEVSPVKQVTRSNGGSAYFDGNGDWLTYPDNAALQFGSGDFTVEFWFYLNSGGPAYQGFFDKGYTGGILIQTRGQTITLWHGGAQLNSNVTAAYNTWYHYAAVRYGSTVTQYLNGVSVGSASTSLNHTSTASLMIGTDTNGGSNVYLSGYLSNLRVVKGTAVYTGNFTPPTAPVTAISGTSLLLNFDNAPIYDGSGNVDLQTMGDTKTSTAVTKLSPGSAYFDGNGDYLTYPHTTATKFGTSDFTIETWIYPTSLALYNICGDRNANDVSGIEIYMLASGQLGMVASTSGSGWGLNTTGGTGSGGITANAWSHIAVTRNGSAWRGFINGVLQWTSSLGGTPVQGTNFRIGYDAGGGYYFTGYMADFRISKGIARYTSNFTPPIAEFPTTAT